MIQYKVYYTNVGAAGVIGFILHTTTSDKETAEHAMTSAARAIGKDLSVIMLKYGGANAEIEKIIPGGAK